MKKWRAVTESLRADILARVRAGEKYEVIALEKDVSPQTVSRVALEAGIRRVKRTDHAAILKSFEDPEATTSTIAAAHKVTTECVRYIARRYGVPLRHRVST